MKTQTSQIRFRATPQMRQALDAIKERDGIPLSEQLRRALASWIVQRDINAVSKRMAHRKVVR